MAGEFASCSGILQVLSCHRASIHICTHKLVVCVACVVVYVCGVRLFRGFCVASMAWGGGRGFNFVSVYRFLSSSIATELKLDLSRVDQVVMANNGELIRPLVVLRIKYTHASTVIVFHSCIIIRSTLCYVVIPCI